jgi:hypothetical protein
LGFWGAGVFSGVSFLLAERKRAITVNPFIYYIGQNSRKRYPTHV